MKKLSSLILCLCLISSAVFAQKPKGIASFTSDYNQSKTDTVVNATTKNQSLKSVNSSTIINVQVTATKISGTTAGVVRFFGSNDNVAWKRITKTGTLSAADSLNLTNVTTPQTIFFEDAPGRYQYYRASLTGSGTASTRFSTTAVSSN